VTETLNLSVEALEERIAPSAAGANPVPEGETPEPSGGGSQGESNGNPGNEVSNGASPQPRP
jgi:hypothetical protein